jgi:CDP-6-deoxy-D-xylo-4-hexulose-3-dehydrase|tara:strand:+ start:35688 stop:36830 length:1143 start_codon:yes stop_codon:yes gene_type:complete
MWKLMTDNAITHKERVDLSEFILHTDKLTQGDTVKLFEKKWSEWLGCKYSVFVNSGSSANLILTRAAKSLNKKDSYSWCAQSCTWSTTISPIIQSEDKLHLCDINLEDFSPNLKQLESIFSEQDTDYLFLTHLLGFSSLSEELLALCDKYDVTLLEDCCEAHGATFNGKKVGTYGLGSSFSFYYGHHMTTIEGGMVCTNNEKLYHELLLLRSHGLLRELPDKEINARKVDDINSSFCFLRDGYNLRNTEVNARLGLLQLPHLDDFVNHRNKLFKLFLDSLDSDKFFTGFNIEGCSNFSFPILVKEHSMLKKVIKALEEIDIEYRPCIAGNLHRHPLTDNIQKRYSDDNSEIIHKNCIYVGNHKDVTKLDVEALCYIINKL